jgi:hypothetical protein
MKSFQSKNHFQCYGCGKLYSSLPQLAGHLSQCAEYRYWKEMEIEDAPYYKLPEALARQENWKRYWRERGEGYYMFTFKRRRAMTQKIQKYRAMRGDWIYNP